MELTFAERGTHSFQSLKMNGCCKPTCVPAGPVCSIVVHCLSDAGVLSSVLMNSHPIQRLRVAQYHSIWSADLCGIGGYHQVLLLPKVSETLTESEISDSTLLQQILLQSVLTDGANLWLPACVGVEETNNDTTCRCDGQEGCYPVIRLPAVDRDLPVMASDSSQKAATRQSAAFALDQDGPKCFGSKRERPNGEDRPAGARYQAKTVYSKPESCDFADSAISANIE